MPAPILCSEETAMLRGYISEEHATRRKVLHGTLAAFGRAYPTDYYHQLAQGNLARWKQHAQSPDSNCNVEIHSGDWGAVTGRLSQQYGECFAVLNFANAIKPGGAYGEGAAAQEENMFRRTNCHYHLLPQHIDEHLGCYTVDMMRLLSATDGRVYLDTAHPRVCIRGPEILNLPDLGYDWLPEDQIFPFFELRAAAKDLRDGSAFDAADAGRRIAAQFETLARAGVRHVVLGAFGCGAFRNPADQVAALYREAIEVRRQFFDVIAFAIFDAGYGPDNFAPFAAEFVDAVTIP